LGIGPHSSFCFLIFKLPREYTYRGLKNNKNHNLIIKPLISKLQKNFFLNNNNDDDDDDQDDVYGSYHGKPQPLRKFTRFIC